MVNFISSFAERVHENVEPQYAEEKQKVKEFLNSAQLISTAALICSVAQTLFAVACIASGGLGGLVGLLMLTVSLPIGYFSYNICRIAVNADNILDNPKKYQNALGLENTFNKSAFRQKISEETYCFNWFINRLIDKLVIQGTIKN